MREVSIYAKIAAIIIIVILIGAGVASVIKNGNKPNEVVVEDVLEVEDITIEAVAEEKYDPVFEKFEWQDYYNSLDEWWDDMKAKNAEAVGIADETIDTYSSVISNEQIDKLRNAESIMTTVLSRADYDTALAEVDAVIAECEDALAAIRAAEEAAKAAANSGGNSGSGGNYNYDYNGGSTPYNFKVMGVLYETNWRWTYYSSRILYHYMTPQWWCDSNGIWRDSNGYAIVACDIYPWGTIIETELFGTCIVMDNGVGSNSTLDLYVNW